MEIINRAWRKAELAAELGVSQRTLLRYMVRWQAVEAAAGRDVDIRPRLWPAKQARRFLEAHR